MERRIYLVALVLVIILGGYLRLVDLGGPSLWLDEILHLEITRSLLNEPWYRFFTGVREIRGGTENGALYYGLQILGQKLAPGDTGVRLLPAVIGTLTLPLMALAGYVLGGRLVALIATFLLAVAPLHVYYSREGRPYYLLMALALLLLLALLKKDSRAGIWMAYGGCLLVAYVGIQAIPLVLSFLILSISGLGRSLKGGESLLRSPYFHFVVAAILALGLSYGLYMTRSKTNIPILATAEGQAENLVPGTEDWGRRRWTAFESPLTRANQEKLLASMTTSGHPSVTMEWRSWGLLAFSMVGLLFGARRRPRRIVVTAGMFVLPVVLSLAALLPLGRWYNISYTSSALPAFLLLVAVGIVAPGQLVSQALAGKLGEPKRRALTWMLAGAILLIVAAPNLAAAREHPYFKLDWRSVAKFFDSVALEDEPVLVANAWPQICLDYYLQDLGRHVEFVNLWESSAVGERAVAERKRGFLLTAGFQKSNDARAWMHQFVPVLKKREEEMALFFFPDFVTLLETRFSAQRGAIFEEQFAAMGRRFDFVSGESSLQGQGWSYPESNTAGEDYQWALGEQAELGLPIGTARDARIRLRVLPFTYPGAPPQMLQLWLNASSIATLELPGGWSEHEVAVPASSWSTGANILYLRFARHMAPSRVDGSSPDHRSLSVAFDFLEVLTVGPG